MKKPKTRASAVHFNISLQSFLHQTNSLLPLPHRRIYGQLVIFSVFNLPLKIPAFWQCISGQNTHNGSSMNHHGSLSSVMTKRILYTGCKPFPTPFLKAFLRLSLWKRQDSIAVNPGLIRWISI